MYATLVGTVLSLGLLLICVFDSLPDITSPVGTTPSEDASISSISLHTVGGCKFEEIPWLSILEICILSGLWELRVVISKIHLSIWIFTRFRESINFSNKWHNSLFVPFQKILSNKISEFLPLLRGKRGK